MRTRKHQLACDKSLGVYIKYEFGNILVNESKNFEGKVGILIVTTNGYHAGAPRVLLVSRSTMVDIVNQQSYDSTVSISGATITSNDTIDLTYSFWGTRL